VLDLAYQAVVLGLLQPHLHPRPRGRVAAQELGQDAGARALERPHPQRPGLPGPQGLHVGPGRLEPRDDRLGMVQEQAAGLRQLDRARASGTLDEPFTHEPLERGQLLGYGGLRVSKRGGRAPEGAVLGDRLEGREMPELDSQPRIRFHDGNHRYLDLN
jgi:hypothetical protein